MEWHYIVIYQTDKGLVCGEKYTKRFDAYYRAESLKVMGTNRIGVSPKTMIPVERWIEHYKKEWAEGRDEG